MSTSESVRNDHISAYPLDWPGQYERTDEDDRQRWPGDLRGTSFGEVRDELLDEAERSVDTGADLVLSTNIETYEKGGRQVPYANQGTPDDPGVAVYVTIDGAPRVFACDRYVKVEGNMRAVATTIRDLRRIQKRGVNEAERAYQGFAQLPAKGETTGKAWWDVLGVDPHAADKADVRAAFRRKAQDAHPDQGGSQDAFARLQRAWSAAQFYYASNST